MSKYFISLKVNNEDEFDFIESLLLKHGVDINIHGRQESTYFDSFRSYCKEPQSYTSKVGLIFYLNNNSIEGWDDIHINSFGYQEHNFDLSKNDYTQELESLLVANKLNLL